MGFIYLVNLFLCRLSLFKLLYFKCMNGMVFLIVEYLKFIEDRYGGNIVIIFI